MSILLDGDTRVLVQGITGRMARFHTRDMLDYGTQVVGGVVPGKGGEEVDGVPVFDTVKAAIEATGAFLGFDPIGGGKSVDQCFRAMERVAAGRMTEAGPNTSSP